MNEQQVALEPRVDIGSLGQLKAQLLEALDMDCCKIDGSAVQRIDGAAVQLLVAFVRDLKLAGGSVRWQRPAPALCEAARLLGVEELLGMGASR